METKVCATCGQAKPVSEFRATRWGGYFSSCNACVNAKSRAIKSSRIEQMSKRNLADFSPRELMEELVRRGYRGKLVYTKTETIDLSNF